MKYIMIPIAIFVLASFVVTVVANLIVNVPSSVMCTDNEKDGKIDISSYVSVLNKEQDKINTTVTNYKNDTESRGGKYKRVYVNYLGGANNNNIKEILSMSAVYLGQDFSNNSAVEDYLVNLFNASNYVTTEESEIYYCSGCENRDYNCYDKPDKYATDKRLSLYKASDHSVEKYVGEAADAQKGCKKSALYSCEEKGHGTYNADGCYKHNNGKAMKTVPEDCDYYSMVTESITEDGVEYRYYCLGHCDGKHYDYSCPGHTEKICKGHTDLYVNVVCLGFDKIFNADPGITVGLDLGDYKQGDLLGTFNITYYCAEKYEHICNSGPPYKTASGTTVTAGKTIAVDFNVIPKGTPVIINGHTYVAEDTGGAIKGNRIDIAVSTHQEALSLGTDVFKVYKAVGKDSSTDGGDGPRNVLEYRELAKAASSELGVTNSLKVFGQAKEPVINWATTRVEFDTAETFQEKLQIYDQKHKAEKFTNAELNALEYVNMSKAELTALAEQRGLNVSSWWDAYAIIENALIPYDKNHPDEFVKTQDENNNLELYFEGWTKDNRDWAKSIFDNMTSDIYYGLEDIGEGSSSSTVSLEGVTIQGSKIDVTYYSQHDSRWANKPVRSDYPKYTISAAGCGPSSMAIVVSSLTSTQIDPLGMCQKYGKTYYQPGSGSYWSIVSGISEAYGLSCTELSYSNVQGVINSLKQGKLVVALVGSGGAGYTGSGFYTGAGHFLVICGVTNDGKFLLADPNEPGVSTSGKGVDMQHFMDSGIKSWWVIGK